MQKALRFVLLATAAVLLAGCAGTNFKRPDAGALEVGKSTAVQVTQVMGQAQQTGEAVRNGEKLKVWRYVYAEGASAGKYPGVVPARAQAFFTHNDRLVAEEFVSSFPTDATDFDEGKVPGITKGKTSRSEVLALLGRPNGQAVHPYTKQAGETAVIYSYGHAKGSVFNMKFYNKALIVSFGADGLVTEVEYSSNGEK